MAEYDFKKIEKKWQKAWEEKKVFEANKDKKEKYYALEMFPYPSGSGLHMGHAFNYTIGDVFSRFKRMQGFNVLHPMGYDSFGLPAENAAIKAHADPKKYTEDAIKNFVKQQRLLGLTYDWTRVLSTHNPDYYKWNQYFFLKFFEKGLVYKKKSPVNWCPKCNTVLANEQVHNGKCWRHEDTEVVLKDLEQWFVKTTDYAEELLEMVEKLNWPDNIKLMQKNWIGKSAGAEVVFEINGEQWPVFTTRPDTIFGVTFVVVSAHHPRLMEITTDEEKNNVEKFVKKIKSVKQEDIDKLEKEGVFTGSYAINPMTKEKVPVYAANFVVADYGSGMVMGVPAHDQRDFDFAVKYNLPIKVVIEPKDFEIYERGGKIAEAYTGQGELVNSENFNGLENNKAKTEIIKFLAKKKLGKKQTQFKIRDWLISRQRYWGTPIPVVYCGKCGVVPVPENELPVKLPKEVKFGKGNPLETNEKWVKTKCSKCGGEARRDTDTLDTFFDSSWYFLRFCDARNEEAPFDFGKVDYWMPVDFYNGGAEHACMHLIYARLFTKILRDFGMLEFDEPFTRLFNQGMIHGEDGFVMSKSRGNVVDPLDMISKYGADSLRLALVSFASPDKDTNWDEKILNGNYKFVRKVFSYFDKMDKEFGKSDERTESKLNKTIKLVTEYLENLKYNLAIIELRNLFNSFSKKTSKDVVEKFLKMLQVFCPHMSQEIWERIGNKGFLANEKWPEFEESKINDSFEREEKSLNRLAEDINSVIAILSKDKKDIEFVYVYVIPPEKKFLEDNLKTIEKKTGTKIKVFSVNDKDKYDPKEKAKRAKPGKPAIYLE